MKKLIGAVALLVLAIAGVKPVFNLLSISVELPPWRSLWSSNLVSDLTNPKLSTEDREFIRAQIKAQADREAALKKRQQAENEREAAQWRELQSQMQTANDEEDRIYQERLKNLPPGSLIPPPPIHVPPALLVRP